MALEHHVMDMAFVMGRCKAGQGAACCRYLAMDDDGFFCAKIDPHLKPAIDKRVELKLMVSRADNCLGVIREPDNL